MTDDRDVTENEAIEYESVQASNAINNAHNDGSPIINCNNGPIEEVIVYGVRIYTIPWFGPTTEVPARWSVNGGGSSGSSSFSVQLGQLPDDYGCSTSEVNERVAKALSMYRASYSAAARSGVDGLRSFLELYKPDSFYTVNWPDGSVSVFRLTAGNSQYPFDYEYSCT